MITKEQAVEKYLEEEWVHELESPRGSVMSGFLAGWEAHEKRAGVLVEALGKIESLSSYRSDQKFIAQTALQTYLNEEEK